jgi:hypothetical protein
LFSGHAIHISPYVACCFAIFFKLLIPALAGRFFSGDEGQESRQRSGYPVTPQFSLSCLLHAEKQNLVGSKNFCAVGEASDIRRDTDGDHQKKSL